MPKVDALVSESTSEEQRQVERTTITPILTADFGVEAGSGGRMPVYVHLIEHRGTRILVDTGIKELHPAMSDMDPQLRDWTAQVDPTSVDMVVNTHLHADHCGGNHLFTSKPIYAQRRELDDAQSLDDYTLREWVQPTGVQYVAIDGEEEIVPGVRLVPAPGHTEGSQVVVVESDDRRVVVAGDAAVWFGELDEPSTEGQRLIRSLEPNLVWLSHEHHAWEPPPSQ